MSRRLPNEMPRLARTGLEIALADLRSEQARCLQIVARIERLRQDCGRVSADTLDGAAPGAGHRLSTWLAWHDRQMARLQGELAAARVRREVCLASARRAFGRKMAVEAMIRVQDDRKARRRDALARMAPHIS